MGNFFNHLSQVLLDFEQYYPFIIMFLATYNICISAFEFTFPLKVHKVSEKWVLSPFFRLHGLFSISFGFPLTQYRNNIPGYFMLLIGIFAVTSGVIIIFYPEKFRELFTDDEFKMDDNSLKNIVRTDAFFRIIAVMIFITVLVTQNELLAYHIFL